MADSSQSDALFSQFYTELEQNNLGPLWKTLRQMVTREPVHDIAPYLWKWKTIRHYVMQSGTLPLGRDSERRVIYLQNPSLMKKGLVGYATNTLYAGIQLLLPGEVAPSHRHSQSAIRFIIEGEGAFTSVDGQKLYMERGDLVLTPAWTWHDHGHEGKEPVIWMDGLDVGLVRYFAASFFEPYADDQYPVKGPNDASVYRYWNGAYRPVTERKKRGYPSPLLSYKWKKTKEVLDQLEKINEICPYDGYAVDYVNPLTGGPAELRVGTMIQRLKPGFHSKAHRHVHSAVYHVMDGKGYTVIDGIRFDWEKGDFFALPPWCWHEHVNTGDTDAHLFSINDRAIVELLNLEREEAYPDNGGHQKVTGQFEPAQVNGVSS